MLQPTTQQYHLSQQYYQSPQYSPVAPIQRDDFRRRELEKDLEHLKSLYRDLEMQYYMELDTTNNGRPALLSAC